MSQVKILCPVCLVETLVSIKDLDEYNLFICKKCKKSFPVDMTEYIKLKSTRYDKTRVAFKYLVRSIDFHVKDDWRLQSSDIKL